MGVVVTEFDRSLPALFLAQARRYGDRAAVLARVEGKFVPISWNEMCDRARAVAAGLIDRGVEPGMRVGILSTNRPEWYLADVGIQLAGAIPVPIYAVSLPREVGYVLRHAKCVAVFCENLAQLDKVRLIAGEVPALHTAVVMDAQGGPETPARPRALSFAALCDAGRARSEAAQREIDERVARIGAGDVFSVIYTSGTTGPPKGVLLTHANVLHICRTFAVVGGAFRVGESDVFLSMLPLAHSLERIGGQYVTMALGATVAYAESLDTVGRDLLDVRPTILLGVPRFYEKLHARVQEGVRNAPPRRQRIFRWAVEVGRRCRPREGVPPRLGLGDRLRLRLADRLVFRKVRARVGGRIRFFVSGGAPLAKETAEFFHAVGFTILEGYGATETCAPATINRPEELRYGTVGKPLPDVDIRIADDGEILIRGPNVFAGYLDDPEATADALRDGWYHSGDVGRFDDDGFLVITDRKKDLIITAGGKNIPPQEIENLIRSDPRIADVFVFGDRRPYLTALVAVEPDAARTAAAAPAGGGPPSAGAARARVREMVEAIVAEKNRDLPRHMQIKRFAVLEEGFSLEAGTLTPTMKVRRKAVIERHRALVESLYEDTPSSASS